jgi:predicted transcriptional regulator
MLPAELAKRARAIRLQQKRLAELAALDESTVQRTLAGETTPLTTTADKIVHALEAEERRLLAHLIGLHGVPAQAGRAA